MYFRFSVVYILQHETGPLMDHIVVYERSIASAMHVAFEYTKPILCTISSVTVIDDDKERWNLYNAIEDIEMERCYAVRRK